MHPRRVGTFTQSSLSLVEAIVKEVVGKNIIELGAGQGPITRRILDNLPEDGNLIAFEIDKRFCKNLEKIKDSRLKVICDCVLDSKDYLQDINYEIDCIVSGLPLTSLDKNQARGILDFCSKSKRFIQYKYFKSDKLLRDYFSEIRVEKVSRNLPPALIYICSNEMN